MTDSDRLTWLEAQMESNYSASPAPTFDLIYNKKILPLRFGGGVDYVLFYPVSENHRPLNIGGSEWMESTVISMDIRTKNSRARVYAIMNELVSQCRALNQSSARHMVKPIRVNDLSNKATDLWRIVVDVEVTDVVTET